MDFHELEAFVALARTLHFAKAAAMVHVSPSALSRLVSRIEAELGVPLLERDTRKVMLTEQGSLFLQFARESLQKRDELHLFMSANDGMLRGTLRIYASVTACYTILPALVRALGEEHGGLKLSVETGDPADAQEALREGRVDIALAALPERGIQGYSMFSVQSTPLVLVASPEGAYGELLQDIARKQELLASRHADFGTDPMLTIARDAPFILPQKGQARDRFERWARARHLSPSIAAEVAGNEAILALAHLGLGLGLVPLLVIENSPFSHGLVQYNPHDAFGHFDIGFILPRQGRTKIHRALEPILSRVYPEGSWLETELREGPGGD